MTQSTRDSIYQAIASVRLIDPHTHINPHSPASSTLADLLGYHYYTELAHSAGMAKSLIQEPGIGPKEKVRRLVQHLTPIENTANYQWLIEICRTLFDFDADRIDTSNWESLYHAAESKMSSAQWPQMVLDQSNVESVFLTNDFDDDLDGFDTQTYVPCLRTDDLVFQFASPSVQQRLTGCSGISLEGSLDSLRLNLRNRFEHFVSRGARACAISLPPDFAPTPISDGRATNALDQLLRKGELADAADQDAVAKRIFWTLAELCDEFGLPFDLMIGVNRGVYADGVHQGQDLYDSRVSLIQYRELFNTFPDVKFPVSVLASVTNQELVSHAWIFPNVFTHGHWWYSNTPSFIARDAMARLEAVPQNKQIAYYSDAYKLEFIHPKFDMYRHVLADLLAEHFVGRCRWSEERAIELGQRILRDNVDEIFPARELRDDIDLGHETVVEDPDATVDDIIAAGSSAALAAGAIGMLEIDAAQPRDADNDSEASIDDTLPMETVVEDLDDQLASNDSNGNLDEDMEKDFLTDSPTLIDDPNETVRIDEVTDEDTDATVDLDPNPSQDEVDLLEVADVELSGPGFANQGHDQDETESFDPDVPALDVGDLFGDETAKDPLAETVDLESDTMSPSIKPLRNEESFLPDEDSIQVKPDPLTGELKFESQADDNDMSEPDDIDLGFADDENNDDTDDLFGDFGKGLKDPS